jgi:hypothetical protein
MVVCALVVASFSSWGLIKEITVCSLRRELLKDLQKTPSAHAKYLPKHSTTGLQHEFSQIIYSKM